MEILAAIGAIVVSALAFLFGKAFGETEKILVEKRRVYEEFLRCAPKPNDAYKAGAEDIFDDSNSKISELLPVVLFYGGPIVLQAATNYIQIFDTASRTLTPDSPPLHEAFKPAARAHNDLILEMRRDAFSMSAFAYHGKSRVQAR